MNLTTFFNLSFFDLQAEFEIELPDFLITNNFIRRENFYSNRDIQMSIGQIDSKHLRDGYFFCEVPFSADIQKTNSDVYSEMNLITYPKIDSLLDFLHCLWLVKDNSVNIFNVVSFFPGRSLLSKLTVQTYLSNCEGEHSSIKFSKNEIISACELWTKKKQLVDSRDNYTKDENPIFPTLHNDITRSIVKGNRKDFNYDQTNCIERAFHFLQIARSQDYLIYKIAFYIPILECLFCTNANEVLQKIRYRVSFYIGTDREDRNTIDELIETCYNIRSRFIHGQKIIESTKAKAQITEAQLLNYSLRLDELVRKVLVNIILHDSARFLLPKDEKEKKFNEFIYDIEGYPYRVN